MQKKARVLTKEICESGRERLINNVRKTGECLVWKGTVVRGDLPVMKLKGKNEYCHKIAYILNNGEIPNNFYVRQTCSNRLCLNPEHLFLEEKLVYGIGRSGVSNVQYCPYYKVWSDMLGRCYSEKRIEKYPTYADCYVCEEWLYFPIFKAWMQTQDWKGLKLDKDLLVPDNRTYSPDTCLFISNEVNCFIRKGFTDRTPITPFVRYNGMITLHCCGDYLGSFPDQISARKAHYEHKRKVGEELAQRQPEKVKEALLRLMDFNNRVVAM